MFNRNASTQMKQCLNHMEWENNSGAGTSKGSSREQSSRPRNSHSSSMGAACSGSHLDTGKKLVDSFPIIQLKKKPECHMQLDKLSPTAKHTVLIDTYSLNLGIADKLDQECMSRETTKLYWTLAFHDQRCNKKRFDNVTIHISSKFGYESRWQATLKALRYIENGKASVKEVEMAIMSYNQKYRSEWTFDALNSYVRHVHDKGNEFPWLIARMAKLAMQLPDLIRHPIPLLKQNSNHAITLSQVQISCLLANAFFCTFPHRNSTKPGSEYYSYSTINFSSLFGNTCMRKEQKLRALFHYFKTVTEEGKRPDGLVTFERIFIPTSQLPNWKKQTDTVTNLHVSPHGAIERDGRGMLQVDFACKFIGGGVLGRGLVQEEIRFLMSPELIVARLFTEKLADNECLKITGAQTYSLYSGYSDSFQWQGPCTDDTMRDEWKRRYCEIVAIDALSFKNPKDQYTEENLKRELNKAYVGFKKDPNIPSDYTPAIATGNWGCGAFNGDPKLKALIQIMAAAVAQRDLAFFTFGNTFQAQELQRMHDILMTQKITVGHLYTLLKSYCDDYSSYLRKSKNVFEYIKEKTGPHSSL